MNRCQDCFYLDPMKEDISGYCTFPFIASIPRFIHKDGFVYNVIIPNDCEVFKPKDNKNDTD